MDRTAQARGARLDPLDRPDTTDPVLLRAILKVRDGAGGGYWWVECAGCDCGWQVPHYAAEKNVG
jgi:hypothetical protein